MENQHQKKDWLSKLRFNSWELEILLVGFVLVVLLQVPDKINQWITYTTISLSPLTNTLDYLVNNFILPIFLFSLSIIIQIMIMSLIVYLVLRAFWIAIIGISSAFPNGINVDALNFYNKYNNNISSLDLEKPSIQLDKLCSSVFAFTFLLVMLIVSISMFLFIGLIFLVFGLYYFVGQFKVVTFFLIFYCLLCSLYFLDIIFFSIVKKIKWKYFAIPYYVFYRIMNLIFLGFLFEKLYYYFISNLRIKQFLFILISTIIFFQINFIVEKEQNYLFPYDSGHKKTSSYRFYADQLTSSNAITEFMDIQFATPRISSYIISGNIIELFVPYYAGIDGIISNTCSLKAVYDSTEVAFNAGDKSISFDSDNLFLNNDFSYSINDVLNCINSFYQISINDSIKIESNFNLFIHPLFNQEGYRMIIDVSGIPMGSHFLTIQLNREFTPADAAEHIIKKNEQNLTLTISNWYEPIYNDQFLLRIPFYKENN